MRPEVSNQPLAVSRRKLLTLGAGAVAGLTIAGPLRAQEAPSGKMSATEAFNAAQTGEIILVDIRRPDEWLGTGIAVGAIALDMRDDSFVASLVGLRQDNPDTPIAMICRTGNRTGHVVSVLAGQGFPGLVDVTEGMAGGPNGRGWKNTGLPVYAGNAVNIAARKFEICNGKC